MQRNPILPVYLNQRMVFDLLAMLEGGITHVTRVESSEKTLGSDKQQYGTAFGLGKAFSSLLSIAVSGEREKYQTKENGARRAEERIHTPASLFFRLRERLHADEMVHVVDEEYKPKASDLVEFKASLARNPLLHTMDSMVSLVRLAEVFSDTTPPTKGVPKNVSKPEKNGQIKILDQMIMFREHLMAGGTADIVAEGIPGGQRALITLETDSLNDPAMADLVDGEFSVLGKIIKTVDGEESSISLIRKSALMVMPRKTLEDMFSNLSQLSTLQGFNLPPLLLEISGPAFHMLPIAIYA